MIRRFFRHIRRQPKPVRDRYAFSFAAVFTGGVTMIWLMNTTVLDFASSDITQKEGSNAPFSTMIKQSKEQFAGLRNAFKDEDLVGESEDDSSESSSDETLVADDPTKIILSDDDMDVVKQKELEAVFYTQNNVATSSSAKPIYQEIQIATIPSASSTDVDLRKATTTDIEVQLDLVETVESAPLN